MIFRVALSLVLFDVEKVWPCLPVIEVPAAIMK
jgi:hypothetical protein